MYHSQYKKAESGTNSKTKGGGRIGIVVLVKKERESREYIYRYIGQNVETRMQ